MDRMRLDAEPQLDFLLLGVFCKEVKDTLDDWIELVDPDRERVFPSCCKGCEKPREEVVRGYPASHHNPKLAGWGRRRKAHFRVPAQSARFLAIGSSPASRRPLEQLERRKLAKDFAYIQRIRIAADGMKRRPRQDFQVLATFGIRLKELREAQPHPEISSAFMPQQLAAARAGLDGSYWGHLERGECDPTLTSLLRIQHGLGLDSIEALLGQTGSVKLGTSLRPR
jgi:hypothetical protein